ncbi:deoxynucleotidyltransferase terminal-interacting protein 2 [Ixodes scapularis]
MKEWLATHGVPRVIETDNGPCYAAQEFKNFSRDWRFQHKERSLTKGPGWFGMPAPELTEDLKRDLQVLRMRRVLDPKRFYKKNDLKDLPKYFQVGTVMDSPTDFYHARVPKKDRKQTLVEELLADAQFRSFNKKKYQEAMAKQQRVSKKALKHMKRLKKRK